MPFTIIADENKDVVIGTLPPAAAIDTNGANRRRLCTHVSIAVLINYINQSSSMITWSLIRTESTRWPLSSDRGRTLFHLEQLQTLEEVLKAMCLWNSHCSCCGSDRGIRGRGTRRTLTRRSRFKGQPTWSSEKVKLELHVRNVEAIQKSVRIRKGLR